MRCHLIDDHREGIPIIRRCNELDVSLGGQCAWRKRPPSAREVANLELFEQIEVVYNEDHGVYGSTPIYRELNV
jgi:hypothetical protein